MPIKIKNGSIYFLRETDVLTGETGSYIKIGQAEDVGKRIDQHQTGNPRKITLIDSIEVIDMDTVEEHLKRVFAEHRILGEWFLFDDATLKSSIAEGERVSALMDESKAFIEQRDLAKKDQADLPEREASSEENTLFERRLDAAARLKIAEAKLKKYKLKLQIGMGSAAGIDEILEITWPTDSRIDTVRIRNEHQDIHERFLEPKTVKKGASWKGRPSLEKLDPELSNEIKLLDKEALDVEELQKGSPAPSNPALKDLHLKYLKAFKELREAKLEKELLETQLMAACGSAGGITNILTWTREPTTRNQFNEKDFETEHPDLAKECRVFSKPKIEVCRMRSYHH